LMFSTVIIFPLASASMVIHSSFPNHPESNMSL
jgi:hypothetical protein